MLSNPEDLNETNQIKSHFIKKKTILEVHGSLLNPLFLTVFLFNRLKSRHLYNHNWRKLRLLCFCWKSPLTQSLMSKKSTNWKLLYRFTDIFITRFSQVDETCVSCQKLIKNYPLIKIVNIARSNLSATLMEIDRLLRIPEKVFYMTAYEWDLRLIILDCWNIEGHGGWYQYLECVRRDS